MRSAFTSRSSQLALLLAFVTVTWLGCSSTPKLPPPPPGSPGTFNPSALREGDVISVTFPGAPSLNSTNTVPFDGTIKLPFADAIQVVGKRTADVEQEILTAYGSQLQLKEVIVNRIFSSARVYVNGAVLRPGPVPLSRPMTVLEVIGEASGFDPRRANVGKVRLTRQEDGVQKTYQLNLKQALKGDPMAPVYVLPSDTITVPEKPINL